MYILCYIQYNIHNNIVHKVSGGIQLRCDITIKQEAIKYAITWAHKARVKMMQIGTSAISATSNHVINHKDVSKPEVKHCKHKYC